MQKLSKVAAPDPFQPTTSSIKDGSRKVGGSNVLSRPQPLKAGPSSRNRFSVSSLYDETLWQLTDEDIAIREEL
jgi:hypothetical protein